MFDDIKAFLLSLPVFNDYAQDTITLGQLGVRILDNAEQGVRVELPIPLLALSQHWEAALSVFMPNPPVIEWMVRVPEPAHRSSLKPVTGVKHLIAVASGKGGVGKSTTAVNLALALVKGGAAVGLLDADIYGPSVPLMLGLSQAGHPKLNKKNMLLPHQAFGLWVMSIGFLAQKNTPMVWRGPMVSGALMQLLHQTAWPALDYLIVDMPPGTGDIQLTLSQKVPVDGAVIVTTPQDIACLDARKGIEMFRKVMVPVFGVIENMSIFHCPHCGQSSSVFGSEGGLQLATQYHVGLLGQLPLSLNIRRLTDEGIPPVATDDQSPEAQSYLHAAARLALACHRHALSKSQIPKITIRDD